MNVLPFSISQLLEIDPYGLDKDQKALIYKNALSSLTAHHYGKCLPYKKILNSLGYDPNNEQSAETQPMIPIRLFKKYDLLSVSREEVVKTMTSSGTTGQSVSKIYLDNENARNQTKVLAGIITSYIGKKRLPLLLLDTEQVKKDRVMFSARGAGIIGFSTFGRDVLYALDEDMRLKTDAIQDFLEKHREECILLFGYTHMIWQYIVNVQKGSDAKIFIENGILFHSGGWKKLKEQAVDTPTYNNSVKETLGNITVHNYYGMVEQLGSVFVECEYGHMHCSIYSDVIIRRHTDFSQAEKGECGLIELLSLLPTSYPGHILLTEDEGVILGEDDCPCGRLGKYFKIYGRIKGAEIRGCSDTYGKC